MANIEPNEIIYSVGSKNSNSNFLKWFANKQVYTTGQVINLDNLTASNEFVTPNGCFGYKISITTTGNTGANPTWSLIVNGTRIDFPLSQTAALYSPYFYESPMTPFVEIKDAISFDNNTGVALVIGIIYYRLKYRDR